MVPALRTAWQQRGFLDSHTVALIASAVSSIGGTGVSVRALLGPYAPPRQARREDSVEVTAAAMLGRQGGDHGNT